MRRRGVVRGQIIEIDGLVGFTEGQHVEKDVRPADAVNGRDEQRADEHEKRFDAIGDLESRIAIEPQFEQFREADRIRKDLEPGFPKFAGFKLKEHPKRDGSIIVRSAKSVNLRSIR